MLSRANNMVYVIIGAAVSDREPTDCLPDKHRILSVSNSQRHGLFEFDAHEHIVLHNY